jgi:hypothetical protein
MLEFSQIHDAFGRAIPIPRPKASHSHIGATRSQARLPDGESGAHRPGSRAPSARGHRGRCRAPASAAPAARARSRGIPLPRVALACAGEDGSRSEPGTDRKLARLGKSGHAAGRRARRPGVTGSPGMESGLSGARRNSLRPADFCLLGVSTLWVDGVVDTQSGRGWLDGVLAFACRAGRQRGARDWGERWDRPRRSSSKARLAPGVGRVSISLRARVIRSFVRLIAARLPVRPWSWACSR